MKPVRSSGGFGPQCGQWCDNRAVWVCAQPDDVTGMSRTTGEPRIGGPEEVLNPRFRDTPGQTASLARERVPPRYDRPAVTGSSGKSGDVRRRRPHPAAGGHDDMRGKATQRGKRPLRHVHVGVEASLEARPHGHPSQVKRPGVELEVLHGQVGFNSPFSVALHRSLGHEQKFDVRPLRKPAPEGPHVTGSPCR